MKRKHLIFFFTILGLCWTISCSRDQSIPHDVIGVKKMGNILLDIQMAEAYTNMGMNDTAKNIHPHHQLKVYYAQILMMHHTDTATFLRSFRFYEHHPDLMKKMYAQMLTEITKKSSAQDSMNTAKYAQQSAMEREIQLMEEFKKRVFFYTSLADSLHSLPYRVFKPDNYRSFDTNPALLKKTIPN